MLPKAYRLPSPLVRKMLRGGKRIGAPGLLLAFLASEQRIPRFAVVVSSSVDKRAVVRNRLKRQIRAALVQVIPTITHPGDGVFMAQKALLAGRANAVTELVTQLIRRAGMLA